MDATARVVRGIPIARMLPWKYLGARRQQMSAPTRTAGLVKRGRAFRPQDAASRKSPTRTLSASILIPPRLYKITGFDYLENFAASLMGTHTNLDTAIDKLFVDRKSLEVDYDKYFVACKVTSCTYTYMSASSFAGLVAVVIGLLGGIQNATCAVFGVVYSQMRGIIVPKDAPESEETETPATETPATEWAQSRKNPV